MKAFNLIDSVYDYFIDNVCEECSYNYRNICEELCEGDLENQNCLHFNDYEEAKKIVSKAEIELNYLV